MVHQYSCGACAFQIRSEDDDEVVELVQNHAKEAHGMDVSTGDVRDGWEEVELSADD
jgi:predicted small metal-binding protein